MLTEDAAADLPFDDEEDDERDPGFTESGPLAFDTESELIPLLRAARYSFSLRANAEEQIVIADRIDTARASEGALVVLVHEQLRFTNTASLSVLLYNMVDAPEEPDLDFVDTTRQLASLPSITSSTQAGALLQAALVTPVAAQTQLRLRMRQFATAGGDQVVTLSIFLLTRSRD